jgi:undecaprenyl-phosphate galactose phosphotransferase/putative colanic acid biosynthesis UDP-glucose lipid carrier transferase
MSIIISQIARCLVLRIGGRVCDARLESAIELKANDFFFAALKRTIDILLGLLAILLLAPIMVLAIALVACDGRRAVLFKQSRTGLWGRKFTIYKIRTMTVVEDGEYAVQCRANDPRVTFVGRVLRKFSIDELPQLINVISGDMSLVGPRPHALAQDREFAVRVPEYMNRYQVKPGITGLAQVRGFRGPTEAPNSLENRIRADVEYIKRQSLMLDLAIILRTVPAVLFRTRSFVTPRPAISHSTATLIGQKQRP